VVPLNKLGPRVADASGGAQRPAAPPTVSERRELELIEALVIFGVIGLVAIYVAGRQYTGVFGVIMLFLVVAAIVAAYVVFVQPSGGGR